uniref:Phage protein n=1 Tax=Heterorhabditis bacteriophora TaxID=37862 RepID=A0A1I7XBS9_HETBA
MVIYSDFSFAPVVNPELEKLVNQVHNDITSYLSVTSLTEYTYHIQHKIDEY